MNSLWDRIWERPIFRTAAAYVVVAWVVVQVASVLVPAFEVADWALRLVVLLTITGLPVVLIVAWAAGRHGSAPRSTSSTMIDFGVIAFVVAAAGFAAFQVPATIQQVNEPLATEALIEQPRGSEANSIAVLPFAAFSDLQEDEFFADGLTEEILNSLARIPGLKVVGRTSVFYYKDRNEDVRSIATQLNVRYVLEGSVRRAGNTLRITAQLIEADSGFHLWSETYDQVLKDVFGIQSKIAHKVASVLEITILGNVIEAEPITMDPEARRLFLVGLARLRQRGRDNIAAAADLFEQALEIDPDQAEVIAHLASARLLAGEYEGYKGAGSPAALTEAGRLIDRALSLDPTCATAHAVRGLLYFQEVAGTMAYGPEEQALAETAKTSLKQAITLDPNHVEARLWLGLILRLVDDDVVGAHGQFQKLLETDPLFLRGLQNAITTLTSLGRLEEARKVLRQLTTLYPNSPDAYFQAATFESALGREDGAIKWTHRAMEVSGGEAVRTDGLFNLADHYESLGAVDHARRLYERLAAEPGKGKQAQLILLADDGAYEEAIDLIDQHPEMFTPHLSVYVRSVIAIRAGQPERVVAWLRESNPQLFQAPLPPLREGLNAPVALMAAYVLKQTGEDTQANRLLERLEAVWSPQPPHFDLICHKTARAAVQAMAGRRDDAIETLQAAVEQGLSRVYNSLCGMMPGPLESHPYFASLADDQAFLAVVENVRAEAQRQLDRVPPMATPDAPEPPAAAMEL